MEIHIASALVISCFSLMALAFISDSDNFKNHYVIDSQYVSDVYPKKENRVNGELSKLDNLKQDLNSNDLYSSNVYIELVGHYDDKRSISTNDDMLSNITSQNCYMCKKEVRSLLQKNNSNYSKNYPAKNFANNNFIQLIQSFRNYNNSTDTRYDTNLYNSENIRKRMLRHANEYRYEKVSFQSLCPIKRKPIILETSKFEYRPKHYIEVICANNFTTLHGNFDDKNRVCSEAGFACMQLNRTMHLIRRNKAVPNECWESEIRVVPSGCECMWPKHHYGDILAYHESEKRSNFGGNDSYSPYL